MNFPFQVHIPKRWSDFDEFGMVNNAKFMTYYEEARVKLFEQFLDWNWAEVGIVVASANLDFKMPIRHKDNPTIYMRCTKIGEKSFTLHCVMAEGETVFSMASFVMVCYHIQAQKPMPIPAHIKQKLADSLLQATE
jgi:acyl-CoA thioester hydrolase